MTASYTLYAIRVPFPDDIKYTFFRNRTDELELYTSKEIASGIAKKYTNGQVIDVRIHSWY